MNIVLKHAGILHAQLRSLTARLGHQGRIAIVDAGYNIPLGIETVDLAFLPNIPSMVQVLEGLLGELSVEKAYLSERIRQAAPQLDAAYQARWDAKTEVTYLPSDEFRAMFSTVKGVIRTGGFGLHSPNIILQAGCVYDE